MLEGVDCNGRRCKKHGQTLSCRKELIAMEEDAQNMAKQSHAGRG